MDEGTLGVHEIELVVDAAESFRDCGSIGDHTDGTLDFGQVASRDDLGRLVVDTALESGGAPVNKANGTLGLDGGYRGVDILGNNVATVHEAAGHVLSVTRVTLGHHVRWLKDGVGDFSNRQRLMVCLLRGNDGSVRRKHEMNTRVGDQVGLELGDVHVEGAIETERGRERRNDLSDETVQVGVRRRLDIEVATADVVERFVVEAEGTIRMLEESMGRKDGVVGLNHGRRNLRRGGDRERELTLATVIDREALCEYHGRTI